MSRVVLATLIIGVALLLAVWVVALARRGLLSMRYTLGWLFVAACSIVGSLFAGLLDPISSALGVEPVVLVLGVATLGLLAITVQLSITASGLIDIVRTLTEAVALLEERVRRGESVGVEVEELEARRDER